jgi:hypothetical protein
VCVCVLCVFRANFGPGPGGTPVCGSATDCPAVSSALQAHRRLHCMGPQGGGMCVLIVPHVSLLLLPLVSERSCRVASSHMFPLFSFCPSCSAWWRVFALRLTSRSNSTPIALLQNLLCEVCWRCGSTLRRYVRGSILVVHSTQYPVRSTKYSTQYTVHVLSLLRVFCFLIWSSLALTLPPQGPADVAAAFYQTYLLQLAQVSGRSRLGLAVAHLAMGTRIRCLF